MKRTEEQDEEETQKSVNSLDFPATSREQQIVASSPLSLSISFSLSVHCALWFSVLGLNKHATFFGPSVWFLFQLASLLLLLLPLLLLLLFLLLLLLLLSSQWFGVQWPQLNTAPTQQRSNGVFVDQIKAIQADLPVGSANTHTHINTLKRNPHITATHTNTLSHTHTQRRARAS